MATTISLTILPPPSSNVDWRTHATLLVAEGEIVAGGDGHLALHFVCWRNRPMDKGTAPGYPKFAPDKDRDGNCARSSAPPKPIVGILCSPGIVARW